MFITPSNAACIKEWFKSFLSSTSFGKICTASRSHLYTFFLLTQAPATLMITKQLITVWQAQCLQVYTDLKVTYFPTYIHIQSLRKASRLYSLVDNTQILCPVDMTYLAVKWHSCPQTTNCLYLAHQWRHPVPLKTW
jgi:hypothetical protein